MLNFYTKQLKDSERALKELEETNLKEFISKLVMMHIFDELRGNYDVMSISSSEVLWPLDKSVNLGLNKDIYLAGLEIVKDRLTQDGFSVNIEDGESISDCYMEVSRENLTDTSDDDSVDVQINVGDNSFTADDIPF